MLEDGCEDPRFLGQTISQTMPGHSESLIEGTDGEDGKKKFTCIIVDFAFGWALDMARNTRLKKASFYVSSLGVLSMTLKISQLIEAGFIVRDDDKPILTFCGWL